MCVKRKGDYRCVGECEREWEMSLNQCLVDLCVAVFFAAMLAVRNKYFSFILSFSHSNNEYSLNFINVNWKSVDGVFEIQTRDLWCQNLPFYLNRCPHVCLYCPHVCLYELEYCSCYCWHCENFCDVYRWVEWGSWWVKYWVRFLACANIEREKEREREGDMSAYLSKCIMRKIMLRMFMFGSPHTLA